MISSTIARMITAEMNRAEISAYAWQTSYTFVFILFQQVTSEQANTYSKTLWTPDSQTEDFS